MSKLQEALDTIKYTKITSTVLDQNETVTSLFPNQIDILQEAIKDYETREYESYIEVKAEYEKELELYKKALELFVNNYLSNDLFKYIYEHNFTQKEVIDIYLEKARKEIENENI